MNNHRVWVSCHSPMFAVVLFAYFSFSTLKDEHTVEGVSLLTNDHDFSPSKEDQNESSFASIDSYENSVSSYWKDLVNPPEKHQAGDLPSAAATLSLLLEKFVNVELRVNQTETYYNSLPFNSRRRKNAGKQSEDVSKKFSMVLKEYEKALGRMEFAITSNVTDSTHMRAQPYKQLPLCCQLKTENLVYDDYFQTFVEKGQACAIVPNKTKSTVFIPGQKFREVLISNADQLPHLKWQYFVSPEGVHIEYPANNLNCKSTGEGSRPLFNSKNMSERNLWLFEKSKEETHRNHRIVFLVQFGNTFDASVVKSIKNIVSLLLRFLDESDKVGIVNTDPEQLWSNYLCDQMVPVTSWARYQIMSYLAHLEYRLNTHTSPASNSTQGTFEKVNQSNGFQKAINIACHNFSTDPQFPPSAATIIYLTSGIDIKEFDVKSFKVNCPIFIDLFALRALNTTEEEEYKSTLQNIASKNIWRVQVFSTSQAEPESFAVKMAMKLNSKKEWWSLSDILSQFFPEDNSESSRSIKFSFPIWNPFTKEAVVYGKKYVFHHNRPLGLVAIEIPLTHFTQHITYNVNENMCSSKNYAVLIDKTGRVIAHPALGRPYMSQELYPPILLNQIEVHHGFSFVNRQILSQEMGCSSIMLRRDKSWVTYDWSVVEGFDYIVILVMFGESGGCSIDVEEIVLKKTILSPKVDIQHHALLTNAAYCNNQLVSSTKAALYFAPSSFQNPADEITPINSNRMSTKFNQALMAYIGDSSGFLQDQNRGLKPNIKEHVAALSSVIKPWKSQFSNSTWSKYILRRYATGAGGTFLILYPGSPVTRGYMPSFTVWYRSAVENKGKIVFSPPTVDPTSGVAISTVSQAVNVWNWKESSFPHPTPIPMAVLAADLNVGFFQKLLEDLFPECRNHSSVASLGSSTQNVTTIRCFLIDSAGFIIYHPSLTRSMKTMSRIHVTQLEPLSVIDVLQQGHSSQNMPMQKKMCHRLSETSSVQGSLRRQYSLSMGLNGIQKLKYGEHCSRYNIVPVPQTNLFLTIVYDACLSATAFCPCSTVDNLCLNCLRMEPSDCECPCECPRDSSVCLRNNVVDLPEDIEPCEFPTETLSMIHHEDFCKQSNDTSCKRSCKEFSNVCSTIALRENCIGSWHCDWCVTEEPLTKTSKSYCETFKQCYDYRTNPKQELKMNRSLSGQGFESDSANSSFVRDDADFDSESESTVLPIVGVLSIFLIFLGFVAYCYRHRALTASDSQPELHLLQRQESPMGSIVPQAGSSRSNSDSEHDPVNFPLHVLVPNRERQRPGRFIIPQRSPLGSIVGTDSDHGYSTMTPHEDSECGGLVPCVSLDPPLIPVSLPASLASQIMSAKPHFTATNINRQSMDSKKQLLVPVSIHHATQS